MEKVVIKAPASTANLGSGFDAMGIALDLCNTVELEEYDRLVIASADGSETPADETNLVYQTVKDVYELCGKKLPGLKITQCSPIPQARGLGSSSACIAAGIAGANQLLGAPLSQQELLDLGCKMEGHPDNVAPAMLGGFVTSVMENGHVYTIRKPVSEELCFCAFVPDFPLLTSKARAALPQAVPHKDAVYNLSRAAFMAAAFCENRPEYFAVAAGDRLHQPYRMGLIPGAEQLFARLPDLGAKAMFISGAGPTIMAITEKSDKVFAEKAAQLLQENEVLGRFKLTKLAARNESMI